ncbi:hypothetical protein AGMMS49949_02260 [Alphaproteobacteria bacterium]|nr:hypothetical protein AGMMS49949_02260 [Alphaproteobacteria bacterium]
MSTFYTTKDRDVLDVICLHHYGYCRGAMEVVLQANSWLATHTSPLPAGLILLLPDIASQPTQKIVRIWS